MEKSARARLPVGLAQVAVDGGGTQTLLFQVLDQPIGASLGAHEEKRLLLRPGDGGRHLHLVHLVHLNEAVLHQGHRLGGRRHLVEDGLGQVALDQTVDGAVERGREQKRLMRRLQAAEHPLDLGHEPHVRHAVGLVEHQRLELGDRDFAPVAEVDQPTRRGDDHVDALVQLRHLAVDVGPAVDRDGAQAERLGQRGQHVVHLDGQFPGGEEDQRQGLRRSGRMSRPLEPCASLVALVRCRSGTPKARVLPEPVLALPQTSRPARASAMVSA